MGGILGWRMTLVSPLVARQPQTHQYRYQSSSERRMLCYRYVACFASVLGPHHPQVGQIIPSALRSEDWSGSYKKSWMRGGIALRCYRALHGIAGRLNWVQTLSVQITWLDIATNVQRPARSPLQISVMCVQCVAQ